MTTELAQMEVPVLAKNGPGRLAWLDGLRGVAILGVVIVHTAYTFPAIGRRAVLVLCVGRHGVDLFFAISGYLFAELMIARPSRRAHYLRRRLLRIVAVYYPAMICYVALAGWRAGSGEWLVNLAFLNPWVAGPESTLVPGGWSICAEVFFYGAGVLLLSLLRSSKGTQLVWILAVLTALTLRTVVANSVLAEDTGPLLNLPTFIAGVLCWHRRHLAPVDAARWVVIAVCFAAVVMVVVAQVAVPRFVIGVPCAVALWAFIGAQPPGWITRVGQLSYSAYASHFALLEWSAVIAVAVLAVGTAPWVAPTVTLLVALPATYAVSFVFHRYVEAPVARIWR